MSDQTVLLPKWFPNGGIFLAKRTAWSLIYFWNYASILILFLPWGDYFGKRTALSLIYFLDYAYLAIWLSLLFLVHTLPLQGIQNRVKLWKWSDELQRSTPSFAYFYSMAQTGLNFYYIRVCQGKDCLKWWLSSPDDIFSFSLNTFFI